MAQKTALKATTETGSSPVHALAWSLPVQQADGSWKPGAWRSCRPGRVQYRQNGLHVCGVDQLAYWTRHLGRQDLTVWVVEYRGRTSIGPHGFAVREARLLRPWDGVEEV